MAITQEQFEHWLAFMDDALRRFFRGLPEDVRNRLDYSLDSLEVIEDWMLKKYPSIDDIVKPDQAETLDGLARYVGETFRKHIGGRWEVLTKDRRYVYYNIPQISHYVPKATPIAPAPLVTACLDRRKGNYIRKVLEAVQEELRNR